MINLLLDSNSFKDLMNILIPSMSEQTEIHRGMALQAGTNVSQHGLYGEPTILLHRDLSGDKSWWGVWLPETSVMNIPWVSLSLQKQPYHLSSMISWRMVFGNYFKK